MDYTSIYGLELLVLEGTGGKALAADHRESINSTTGIDFSVDHQS